MYADESGMDERDDYGYGYSKEGERFHDLKSGRRNGRVNMIAALCGKELLAPFTVEGSCNRDVFETWLEKCWSWLKSRIRKKLDEFETLREAMEHVLDLAS